MVKSQSDKTAKIYINDKKIKHKKTARYLGVYFDKWLNRYRQIEHMNSKLNRAIGILRKLRAYQLHLGPIALQWVNIYY